MKTRPWTRQSSTTTRSRTTTAIHLKFSSAERRSTTSRNQTLFNRPESTEDIIKGIYEHSDEEIGKKDEEIAALKTELQKINGDDIPLTQIVREAALSYPVRELSINRGNIASADSLKAENSIVVVAKTSKAMSRSEKAKMLAWLKVRLGQDNISLFCTQE